MNPSVLCSFIYVSSFSFSVGLITRPLTVERLNTLTVSKPPVFLSLKFCKYLQVFMLVETEIFELEELRC